jgi:hypothetical protein
MRLTLFATVFAIGLWPSDAHACDCDVPPLALAIAGADVIVTGRITKLEWVEASDIVQVEILIKESLKGPAAKGKLVAYSRPYGSSCYGYDLRISREYVVFASLLQRAREPINLPASSYLIGLCGGTSELNQRLGTQRLIATKEMLRKR